jgi:glycosyltransferase involved in cell wall biosynthesis
MRETILHIFDQPVPPPPDAGGANRLIHWLANAQANLGHKMFVAAPAGNDTKAYAFQKIPVNFSINHIKEIVLQGVTAIEYHGGGQKGVAEKFDEFHIPILRIQHGVAKHVLVGKNMVYVSKNHAQFHAGNIFAYNGIPLDEYTYQEKKLDYYLFLAKVKRLKKGVSEAITIAKESGIKLIIAGGRRIGSPHTWFGWHPRIKPVGFVNGDYKKQLLSGARALIVPIHWEEPFGLSMIEAMASGTPVIAYNRGAVPEVVEHGVTGFVCNTREEMIEAIIHVGDIDPMQCRMRTENMFSDMIMAKKHLELIHQVRAGNSW